MQLQASLDDFFNARVIEVVLDPRLIAKAAAGATRIRLRAGAAFSDYDRHQLLEHEAFVHSLTALNGREQPQMQSLSLSSPRTTATQEGLATFAEQITGSIDIERMKRISLRIEAVARAMEGADFLEIFRFFLNMGQPPVESFVSAQRVFRGVPTSGGCAFTKDTCTCAACWRAHVLPLGLAPEEAAPVPHVVRGQDDDRRRATFRTDVRAALAPPRYLPTWVARERAGRDARVFAVRQPHPPGPGDAGRRLVRTRLTQRAQRAVGLDFEAAGAAPSTIDTRLPCARRGTSTDAHSARRAGADRQDAPANVAASAGVNTDCTRATSRIANITGPACKAVNIANTVIAPRPRARRTRPCRRNAHRRHRREAVSVVIPRESQHEHGRKRGHATNEKAEGEATTRLP